MLQVLRKRKEEEPAVSRLGGEHGDDVQPVGLFFVNGLEQHSEEQCNSIMSYLSARYHRAEVRDASNLLYVRSSAGNGGAAEQGPVSQSVAVYFFTSFSLCTLLIEHGIVWNCHGKGHQKETVFNVLQNILNREVKNPA
ncbi:hypothetical protein F2P81_004261 [Scophthalmus maximus]|uniref:Uncharacterized protein n=1 Tax=Scophthalmus maximus TaxID=52904 RepID=A0A6A4TI48_SCOMX|nr:hypothetical protein F2P81_004261 [Scophthalmus maximus]